jgi:electron transfer flavoprotein alpha subunit
MDLDDLAFLMGEDAPSESAGADYRNIWVVAERAGAGVSRTTRQVMGKARELGDRLGARVEAVLLAHDADTAAQALVELGADRVYLADDPLLAEFSGDLWLKLLASLVGEKRPEILLFGFTSIGKEVAPRLAQRLNTGLVADVNQLDLDENERLLIATRSSFGGRALATVTCPKARPQMVTVRPNAFAEPEPDKSREGEIERVPVELYEGDRRVHITGTAAMPTDQPVERARVLVVGGKGLVGPEGAELLQQLASALGGQVAGTRGAVEAGWFEAHKEVSGRGATVAPDLYVGVGVSGSMDHIDAMRQSRTIVAINTKADAPLMEMADYALPGDYREVVPALLEIIQAMRAKRASPVTAR